jgi:hypothetical protein
VVVTYETQQSHTQERRGTLQLLTAKNLPQVYNILEGEGGGVPRFWVTTRGEGWENEGEGGKQNTQR